MKDIKNLYTVENPDKLRYVVAENLTQVVNQYPDAVKIEWICSTQSSTTCELTIL